jgi:hypothetical protein
MSIGVSGGSEEVRKRQARLSALVERLRPTGGEISLYAHECEFATHMFWDEINYAHGKDTPRDRWQPAPLISEEEREARYVAMGDLLAFVRSLPDVQVVVASQSPVLYADMAKGRAFTPQQIAAACAPLVDAITHQRCEGAWLSPGELFGMVVELLASRARNGEWPDRVAYRYFDGPPKQPRRESVSDNLPLDGVLGTCLYESARLDADRRMPSEVQVGQGWLSPSDFLATIAAALPRWLNGITDDASVVRGNFVQAKYIPDHVSWGWVIFPRGFSADPLLEIGKLQAWTLKPAPLLSSV